MSTSQRILLVVLRSVIGWHFLYEGYFKLLRPAWGSDGLPLPPWSSGGYLRGATGPLAGLFHAIGSAPWIGTVDQIVAGALVVVGLGLMLGLFTQWACAGGIALLALFYLSAIPTTGLPGPGMEGAYLLVNKNLIELVALTVLQAFGTGRIAGIDRWLTAVRSRARPEIKRVAA